MHTGSLISPWKAKHFYLTMDYLYDETGNKLTGKLNLKHVSNVQDDNKTGFKLITKDKDYRYACKSEEEKEEWSKYLNQLLNPPLKAKTSIFEMFN
jgi:hypothetical protein